MLFRSRDVVGGADVLKVAADHVDAMLGLKVGSGAEIAKILSGTASFTGVVNSGAVSTAISVTVTGAAPGNKNLVIGSIDLPAGGYGSGYEQVVVEGVVSAADTVKLFVRNSSGQNVSWTGATVRALVIQMA